VCVCVCVASGEIILLLFSFVMWHAVGRQFFVVFLFFVKYFSSQNQLRGSLSSNVHLCNF